MKRFLLNLVRSLLPDNKELNDYPYILVGRTGYKERYTLTAIIFDSKEKVESFLRDEVSNNERPEWIVYHLEKI